MHVVKVASHSLMTCFCLALKARDIRFASCQHISIKEHATSADIFHGSLYVDCALFQPRLMCHPALNIILHVENTMCGNSATFARCFWQGIHFHKLRWLEIPRGESAPETDMGSSQCLPSLQSEQSDIRIILDKLRDSWGPAFHMEVWSEVGCSKSCKTNTPHMFRSSSSDVDTSGFNFLVNRRGPDI